MNTPLYNQNILNTPLHNQNILNTPLDNQNILNTPLDNQIDITNLETQFCQDFFIKVDQLIVEFP